MERIEVCVSLFKPSFMIGGVYGWEVVLRSEWCQRATAGRCPALLLFQLRFNTHPDGAISCLPKPRAIIGHCLKSARIRLQLYVLENLTGEKETVTFDLASLHVQSDNYYHIIVFPYLFIYILFLNVFFLCLFKMFNIKRGLLMHPYFVIFGNE